MYFKISKDRNQSWSYCNVYDDIIPDLESSEEIILDCETEGLIFYKHKLVSIVLGTNNAYYILKITDDNLEDIKAVMYELSQNKLVVGHNLSFDLPFIKYHLGVDISNWKVFDTYQEEVILTKGDTTSSKALSSLIYEYCAVEVEKNKGIQKSFRYDLDLTEEQILYMVDDVKYIPEIKKTQLEIREQYMSQGLGTERYYQLEHDLVVALSDIQTTGIVYDTVLHATNAAKTKELLEREEYYIFLFLKRMYSKYKLNEGDYGSKILISSKEDLNKINLGSPIQLKALLNQFDPTIPDTREDTLSHYKSVSTNGDLKIFLGKLLDFRHNQKLVSSYGDKILEAVNYENGVPIIRTNYSQNMTTTGRLISSDVKSGNTKNFINFQNLPQSEDIRACFTARENYKVLTIDFSQCEIRVVTSESDDEVLKKFFKDGFDLHSRLATISYRIITNDPNFIVSSTINSHLRNIHKPILFGILYGSGPAGVARVLNIPLKVAKQVFEAIKSELGGAFEFLDTFVETSLGNGFAVANDVSRRFYILNEYSAYKKVGEYYPNRARLARQLYNFPMQATNADMMKSVILDLFKYFKSEYMRPLDCRILMSIYDEIVCEIPKDYEDLVAVIVQRIKDVCNQFLKNGVTMECNHRLETHWVK